MALCCAHVFPGSTGRPLHLELYTVAVQQECRKPHAADDSKAAGNFVESKFDQQKVHTIPCAADAHQTAEGIGMTLALPVRDEAILVSRPNELVKKSEHLVALAIVWAPADEVVMKVAAVIK